MSNGHFPHTGILKMVFCFFLVLLKSLTLTSKTGWDCCGGESTAFIFSRLPRSLPPTPLCIIHLSSLSLSTAAAGPLWPAQKWILTHAVHKKKTAAKSTDCFGTQGANVSYHSVRIGIWTFWTFSHVDNSVSGTLYRQEYRWLTVAYFNSAT